MWIILIVAGALRYALEFACPVVSRPRKRSWVWRVWGLNLLQVPVVLAAASAWRSLADGASWLHLSHRLAPWAAGIVGYIGYTFVFYWWHRARHASDFVWRTLHQIHHSPQRLELVTAFYKHPLETLFNTMIAAVLMFGILGLDLHAAVITTLLAGLADMFYHANVRTPPLGRRPDPAARDASAAPRTRAARRQLRRPAAVGLAVRDASSPGRRRHRVRVRCRTGGAAVADDPVRRRAHDGFDHAALGDASPIDPRIRIRGMPSKMTS